jgi:hypothetical protein
MNDASTVTLAVFKGFSAFVTGAFAAPVEVDVDAPPDTGAGVVVRLGSLLPVTCKSLPCVSIRADGKLANLVSSATGSLDLASAKRASTAGEDFVEQDQSYYRMIGMVIEEVASVLSGLYSRHSLKARPE